MTTLAKLITLPAFSAMLVICSCSGNNTGTVEKAEIHTMDSTSKEVEKTTAQLEEQTKKVEESLEKLDDEFEN